MAVGDASEVGEVGLESAHISDVLFAVRYFVLLGRLCLGGFGSG